ncbi:BgTH12-06948 [Blumeria graminis f. sp. triticale]|uniref:BgTH12-06948 n=1 Tax=Blumeria graminis f. sp. triticale TaxID=1689686 RepID=A0A9W4GI99_BLUGR|nr:BgTH12-06948 [Blumeria graminis f. sp. triticale]
MRMIFGISLAITGLIYPIKCTDIPYSDFHLPDGTNGFVCKMDIFTIDQVREVAKNAFESFYLGLSYRKFPKLFEDTHLFHEQAEILLSWPVVLSRSLYINGNPGKIRLVINIWGQIIGLVMVDFDIKSQEANHEKCSPVRNSVQEDNTQNSFWNELLSIASPTLGFSCGLNFFSVPTVDMVMNMIRNNKSRVRGGQKMNENYLVKYTGTDFKGVDLYSYPVRKSVRDNATSGLPGTFRIVFDANNYEFKGIINVQDSEIKFGTVWDLSSTKPHKFYSPSSVLNLGSNPDSYWPRTCFGHNFKSTAIWLYLEFVLKEWPSQMDGYKLNFPIVKKQVLRLWPIRIPETQISDLKHAFAIGYNSTLDAYGLYQAKINDGKLSNFQKCMDFTQDEMQLVRGVIDPSTQS